MKDEGMPLGDFRFCFRCQPCSQELKARVASLNAVTGAQIRTNLARAAHEAEIARLEVINQRVEAQMKAKARNRGGQSMALAAQIRKVGYTAKRGEVPAWRQTARDFDDRTLSCSCWAGWTSCQQRVRCTSRAFSINTSPIWTMPTDSGRSESY